MKYRANEHASTTVDADDTAFSATRAQVRAPASRKAPTSEEAPVARRAPVRPPPPPEPAAQDRPRTSVEPELDRRAALIRHRAPGLYERFVKPVIDRLVAALMIALFCPVLLTTALALWFALGSPILFRQERVGRGSTPFNMYKFRTMQPDRRRRNQRFHGPDRRRTHKTADDPRHTRLGRFLRRRSLDEFPQLFNVLKGQMSLVGPRPELVDIVRRYEPWQHARHLVKPGLTGLWQISQRGNGLMHEHVDIDLDYVERISFVTDCKVLFKTIPALFKRDTA